MKKIKKGKQKINQLGLVRDLNPGPLAPEARIIPLDQRAILGCPEAVQMDNASICLTKLKSSKEFHTENEGVCSKG
ncbi:hypothetical protein ANTQUA_LOCUS5647 [Anthophora quadrimaculata]